MIKITIKEFLDGEHQEKLEQALVDCLNKFSLEAEIENTETGNSMSIHNTYQLSNIVKNLK